MSCLTQYSSSLKNARLFSCIILITQPWYRRTLRILEAAQPDIWLTNHNEAFGYSDKLTRAKAEGVKAWLDPEGYRKWVRGARERFEGAVK